MVFVYFRNLVRFIYTRNYLLKKFILYGYQFQGLLIIIGKSAFFQKYNKFIQELTEISFSHLQIKNKLK